MANGVNEPIEFTRGDAERIARIEIMLTNVTNFIGKHIIIHETIKTSIDSNSRFRKISVKIMLWIFTTSAGLGLLAVGAEAIGWLN